MGNLQSLQVNQWVQGVAVSIATENWTFTVIEGTNLTTWDGFSFDPNL